jgi:hypothetical protein
MRRFVPDESSHGVLGGVEERSVVRMLLAIRAVRVERLAQLGMALTQLQRRVLFAALQLLAKFGRRSTHGDQVKRLLFGHCSPLCRSH